MQVSDPSRLSALLTFYRIVKSDPPTPADFLSLDTQGRVPSGELTKDQLRQWKGISVFFTHEQALRQARRFPRLGRFIAELHIADNGLIIFERTNPGSPGHHTLWGTPEDLLRSVVSVERVSTTEKE